MMCHFNGTMFEIKCLSLFLYAHCVVRWLQNYRPMTNDLNRTRSRTNRERFDVILFCYLSFHLLFCLGLSVHHAIAVCLISAPQMCLSSLGSFYRTDPTTFVFFCRSWNFNKLFRIVLFWIAKINLGALSGWMFGSWLFLYQNSNTTNTFNKLLMYFFSLFLLFYFS